MKNAIKPLAKSVLISIGLPAAAGATDAVIHKKRFRFGRPSDLTSRTVTLIILN